MPCPCQQGGTQPRPRGTGLDCVGGGKREKSNSCSEGVQRVSQTRGLLVSRQAFVLQEKWPKKGNESYQDKINNPTTDWDYWLQSPARRLLSCLFNLLFSRTTQKVPKPISIKFGGETSPRGRKVLCGERAVFCYWINCRAFTRSMSGLIFHFSSKKYSTWKV